jgi:hypothetical protein
VQVTQSPELQEDAKEATTTAATKNINFFIIVFFSLGI